jgi:Arc/MetJ-type ribon-helix-helix transcriptional regulator
MSDDIPADVAQLINDQMRQGSYASPDDVLREALKALAERNEDLAAIRAGIEDMTAGRATPLSQVDAAIRERLGYRPIE